eukprot:TRINITY_DN7460_c0_g2_i8.p1 TRINITY_DN7460_c0_g2~~TRINITY_DN7460_c0_g2_i8.p1  ORF type:complete len:415 (-),score=64.77 TRINITY_DN7460_c0_g2_i8:44-1288(-)
MCIRDRLKCFSKILKQCDQGLQIQVVEFLKLIMDPLNDMKNDTVEYIYDQLLPDLFKHFNDQTHYNEAFFNFVQQYSELLIYCIKNHGYRIRQYIVTHKLIQHLFKGFQVPEKSVQLAVLRVFKNVLKSHDDILIKHIHSNNLLEKVFNLYLKYANKTNMLNSACLEIFEVIRKDNLQKLIIQFVESFGDQIKQKNLEKFFSQIFTKYEQIKDTSYEMQSLQSNKESISKSQQGLSVPNPQTEISQASNGSKTPISVEEESGNDDQKERLEEEEYFDQEEQVNQDEAALTENGEKQVQEQSQDGDGSVQSEGEEEQKKEGLNRLRKITSSISSKHQKEAEEAEEEANAFKIGKKQRKNSNDKKLINFSLNLEENNCKNDNSLLEKRHLETLEDGVSTKKQIKIDLKVQEKQISF